MSPPSSITRLPIKEARRNPPRLDLKDRAILTALHATRFATIKQLATLLELTRPPTHTRLISLYRNHYINRQAWGKEYIYTLDKLGIEYIDTAKGIPEENLRKQRSRNVSPYFLDHYLAITDVYISFQVATRGTDVLLVWRSEVEAADRYKLPSGKSCKLNPDAVFALSGPGFKSTLAFLEVDRGTESMRQWTSKIRDYNNYFLSGQVARRWPIPSRVFVLVTAPDLKRADRLRCFTKGRWRPLIGEDLVPMGFTIQEAVTPERILDLPWMALEEETSFRLNS